MSDMERGGKAGEVVGVALGSGPSAGRAGPGRRTGARGRSKPLLQAALAYAARGLAVFPVWELNPEGTDCACPTGHPSRRNEDGKNPQRHCKSPAKHPRTAHGFKDASKDPEKIRGWWADSPRAHVAIATGAVSNMDALDVDPRSWGDDTLHDLEKA